jgi:hypothetical protein
VQSSIESCTDINSKGDGIDGRSIPECQCTGFQSPFHRKKNYQHTAIVSNKSTSEREYSMIIPKSDTLGSRFEKCTCGFPKKEGNPCQHMVAVSELEKFDGLTRSAVTPH